MCVGREPMLQSGEVLFSECEPDLGEYLLWETRMRARRLLDLRMHDLDLGYNNLSEVCARLAKRARVAPLVVDFGRFEAQAQAIEAPLGPRGRMKPAMMVRRRLSFTGEARLWRMRLNRSTGTAPRALIGEHKIDVVIAVTYERREVAEAAADWALANIAHYVTWHREQVAAFDVRLADLLEPVAREARMELHARA